MIQRLIEDFWKVSSGIVCNNAQNGAWPKSANCLIVHNALIPPRHWELDYITVCRSGDDGLIRVVTVKTNRSEYK